MKKIEANGVKAKVRNPSSKIEPLSKANSLEIKYYPITQDARPALSDFISGYYSEIGPAKGLLLPVQYALGQV